MRNQIKMKKDLLFYLFSEAVVKLMPFLLIPVFTRYLGAQDFGALSIYRAYAAIFVILIGFSFSGAISRYKFSHGILGLDVLIVVSSIFSMIIWLFVIVIAYLINDKLLIMASCTSLLQGIMTSCLAKLQAFRKAKEFMIIQLSNVLVSTCITLLIFNYIEASVDGRVLALLIALVVSIIFIYPYKTITKLTMHRFMVYSRYLFFFSFPLVISNLSMALKGNVDRFIIEGRYGLSELGVMSVGMQIGSVLTIIYMVSNRAITPFVYQAFKDGCKRTTFLGYEVLLVVVLVSALPSLVAFMVPEFYYVYLLGSGFEGVKYFIVSYLFSNSFGFLTICFSWYYFYLGKNKYILIATIISSIIHVALVYIFSMYGAKLIPFATLISTMFNVVILFLMKGRLLVLR